MNRRFRAATLSMLLAMTTARAARGQAPSSPYPGPPAPPAPTTTSPAPPAAPSAPSTPWAGQPPTAPPAPAPYGAPPPPFPVAPYAWRPAPAGTDQRPCPRYAACPAPPRLALDPYYDASRARKRTKKGLVIAGGATIGAGWAPTVVVGYVSLLFSGGQRPELALMFIPVVGPFITMAASEIPDSGATFLAVTGTVQATGLLILVTGLALPKVPFPKTAGAGGPRWSIAPAVGKSFSGAAAQASF